MAYTFRMGDLPKLDFQVDRGTDFKAWKSQWDAYASLSGLDGQPDNKQVQALTLVCFSRETVTIIDNLGLTEAQRASATEIVAAIQRYVEGQINESVERRPWRQPSQNAGHRKQPRSSELQSQIPQAMPKFKQSEGSTTPPRFSLARHAQDVAPDFTRVVGNNAQLTAAHATDVRKSVTWQECAGDRRRPR